MVKVTVLYNLPPGTDEAEFVRWRTTTHHQSNIAQPGVLRSDFYLVSATAGVGPERPPTEHAPYRFITEVYYDSMEAFRAAWYAPSEQERLVPAVAKIADALFLVSEEVQTYEARTAGG